MPLLLLLLAAALRAGSIPTASASGSPTVASETPGTRGPLGNTPSSLGGEPPHQRSRKSVRLGIDVWRERGFTPLAGRRVGLITNHSGRDAAGRLTAEILATTDELSLAALYSPEHGFLGVEEGPVSSGTDATTGLPVFSLYGETRRPTDEMLTGVEGLAFDIQDIGTRFYTYATTMAYAMEEAAARDIPFVVLDRPNPITGTYIEGPVLHEQMLSFAGYAPLPLRHGMTIGELARYFNEERGIGAKLTVVPTEGWTREQWYDATGLLWVSPSPNMRNLNQAVLYPAVGPLETTNVSVGRGTDEPFEWFGAPWIDALALASRLNDADLPGIRFVPRRRTPDRSVYAGERCNGVDLILADRDLFSAARTAITLAAAIYAIHGDLWQLDGFSQLWGRPEVVDQLRSGTSPAAIAATWQQELDDFVSVREQYLLYD